MYCDCAKRIVSSVSRQAMQEADELAFASQPNTRSTASLTTNFVECDRRRELRMFLVPSARLLRWFGSAWRVLYCYALLLFLSLVSSSVCSSVRK
jgi:hypothetical protein